MMMMMSNCWILARKFHLRSTHLYELCRSYCACVLCLLCSAVLYYTAALSSVRCDSFTFPIKYVAWSKHCWNTMVIWQVLKTEMVKHFRHCVIWELINIVPLNYDASFILQWLMLWLKWIHWQVLRFAASLYPDGHWKLPGKFWQPCWQWVHYWAKSNACCPRTRLSELDNDDDGCMQSEHSTTVH